MSLDDYRRKRNPGYTPEPLEDGDPHEGLHHAPMLATSAETLPTGDEWAFEPKWDGYRALVRITGGEATLRSRNGNDLTGRFPSVAKALVAAVRSPAAVLAIA